MKYGILVIAVARGDMPINQWLQSYDGPEDVHGERQIVVTTKKEDAKRFDSMLAATTFWTQTSETVPIREDGKPNRPLTGLTVLIEKVP